jgi:hypothetical protein
MSNILSFNFFKFAYDFIYKQVVKDSINNTKQTLEPFASILKLALISFQSEGTKIAVSNNRIYIQTPTILQGTIRSMYGNNREEVHHLLKPLMRSVELYPPDKNEEIKYIYQLAIKGLKKLKRSYDSNSSTVCYTIDLYISILDRANMSKSVYIDSYEESKNHLFDNLDDKKINFENIFKDVWSEKDIHVLSQMFKLTEENSQCSYLTSIENMITSKEELMTDTLKKASMMI